MSAPGKSVVVPMRGPGHCDDDAPTYMRLAQALSRHPEVMVVERSDPTLELTQDSLEHLLEDVFPLAALSPEAPAREGVKYTIRQEYGFGITEHDPALTPRHEAPASHAFEASHSIQREGGCKVCGHDEASHEAPADAPEVALEDAKAFGIGFIVDGARVSPDRVTVCRGDEAPASKNDYTAPKTIIEAPAEGAGSLLPCPFCGEAVRIRRGVNGYGHCQTEGCHANRAQTVSLDDEKQVAAWNLRARSSAPEAREPKLDDGFEAWLNDRNLLPHGAWDWPSIIAMLNHHEDALAAPEAREEALGNLLAVIHGDGGHRALEVGTKQAALEAEKIVAGLFAAPSADKLREFGKHTNLELSYGHGDEAEDGAWQVHSVNGGVNDREWDLIGSGATPADAIDQALAAPKAEV